MGQNEKERDIEVKMRQYAVACEQLLEEMEKSGEKEERIKTLLQIAPPSRTRGNRWNFVLEQIGYLGRYCLVWQVLWAVLFLYFMRHGVPYLGKMDRENEVLVLISLLPPLLVLLTVEEITKVYQRSMLEIEYATKYSLQNVVLVRMLTLSVFHALILAAAIVSVHAGVDSDIGTLLVYGFTPMILVTGILMKLMQCCHGEQLRSAGISVYVMTVICAVGGNTKYFGWYQPKYFGIWCLLGIAGMIFAIWQFDCLRRKLDSYEQIAEL